MEHGGGSGLREAKLCGIFKITLQRALARCKAEKVMARSMTIYGKYNSRGYEKAFVEVGADGTSELG